LRDSIHQTQTHQDGGERAWRARHGSAT
jgi:hypothetical protein